MMNGTMTGQEYRAITAEILLCGWKCRNCARVLPLAEHWACKVSERDQAYVARWCDRPLLVRPLPINLNTQACVFFVPDESST